MPTLSSTAPRALLWLICAMAVLAGASCKTVEEAKRKPSFVSPAQTNLRITSFEIEGVEALDVDNIKEGLATKEVSDWRTTVQWLPLIGKAPNFFNRVEWNRDIERIKTFYRANGYFGAEVVAQNIIEDRDKRQVRIRIKIREGEPTQVSEMLIEGVESLDQQMRRALVDDLPLDDGEVFTQQAYLDTRNLLLQRLERASYAYAEVTGRAVVNPRTRQAQVFYFLDPGPKAYFNKVYVTGLDEIEERFIQDAIPFEQGAAYSTALLQETQEDIYDLGVFALVSVIPENRADARLFADFAADDASGFSQDSGEMGELVEESIAGGELPPVERDPTEDEEPLLPEGEGLDPEIVEEGEDVAEEATVPGPLGISDVLAAAQEEAEVRAELDPEIDVFIRLKEARFWNVEVGTGVGIESTTQRVQGIFNWSSRNFLGGLRKLRHSNMVGYAWAFDPDTVGFVPAPLAEAGLIRNEGIVLRSELEFRQPQFIERKLNLRIAPAIQRDVEVGFRYWNPSLTVGVDRRFFRHLTVALNYRLSYYAFDNLDPAIAAETPLGADFSDEFLLELLEQRFLLDYRDNPLDPREGAAARLTLQEARNYAIGGEFEFFKVVTGVEGYVPFELWTDWVLAMKTQLGGIYNLEPVATGPEDSVETQPVPTLTRFDAGGRGSIRSFGQDNLSVYSATLRSAVPVGGSTLFEATVEPRFQLVRNLGGVGDLWGAFYLDAATVLRGQLLFETPASESLQLDTVGFGDIYDSLLYGVGTGVWWLTPIGPVRADFAYTLTSLEGDPRFIACEDGLVEGPVASGSGLEGSVITGAECANVDVERTRLIQEERLQKWNFYIGIGHPF